MNQVLNETELCLFLVAIIFTFEGGKQPKVNIGRIPQLNHIDSFDVVLLKSNTNWNSLFLLHRFLGF